MASADLRDELTCSICLSLYTDPVTLKCGHNFCRECIEEVLDTQTESVGYSCPQCRAEFQERPLLQRNTTLRNIAEHFISREEQQECEIFCTYCVHTTVVASKTCLWCEASLCDLHLKAHNKSPEHVLIQPTKSFRNRRCSEHQKILMYYCTEDAECLCVSCGLGEKHRGHQVELLNEASKKKREKLRMTQDNVIKEREEIVKRVQNLQDHLRHIPQKAAGIVDGVCVQFREIRMKLDNLEKRVLKKISEQQEKVSLSVKDLIQQLEIKMDTLSKEISTIEDVSQLTDPLHYLQADRGDFADLMEERNRNLIETKAEDLDEDLIYQSLNSGMVDIMSGLQKGYYVPEASGLLWDVTTASNDVQISDDLKTAAWTEVSQGRPDNESERFTNSIVLGMKGISEGKHYWDVEVSEDGGWRVGMSYRSIRRKGEYSFIGNNKSSWGLRSFNKQYSVRHSGKEIPILCRPSSCKVRIYLDYTAGQLSFYELGNSIRHLYTCSTTFTEALYPVSAVWGKAWVRLLS
ncbi:nuclear factor 7, brain-like [Leptodactylus fuscus]|uniref:nuclear factor 7, brain-like n=1 Tax=Leptodactylus fuscus TaxID=238119 RepID=UPI003F4E78B7